MGVIDGDRSWYRHYPPGVPREVDLSRYRSLVGILEESCARFGSRPAFSCMGQVQNYTELEAQSRAFACYLLQELKLNRGDRVALMMPNLLQYPIALFGTLRAGMVVVNCNPLYTPRELNHQLKDSGAKALVVLENMASVAAQSLAGTDVKTVVVTAVGDRLPFVKRLLTNFVVRKVKKAVPAYSLPGAHDFNSVLARHADGKLPDIEIGHEDLAFLQYTGGTTGVSKGAMLTHGNMVANVLQAKAWIAINAKEGEEEVITALPLYHIFALTVNCLVFMSMGGCNHLIPNPRDLPGFVKELKKLRFTGFSGVNTLYNGLLNTPGFDQLDFSHLKISIGGGMAVQRAVAERWKQVTGCALIEGFGLTEASPCCSMLPANAKDYNGSIGLPLPSTDYSIRDDDFRPLAVGEVGELCVRGPQVMKGYWQRPEETAKTLTPDGWLKTGDIARMDKDGYTYIVDRKKDMILVSGFNVYPNEIEDVLVTLPGVLEAAVVGEPDAKSGEAVKAVIVRKDPNLTEAQVRAHCEQHLTGYKRPKYIEFRSELPKTNVGKILRRELRSKPAA
jgi:long-chain acyl-CoA synthetase